MSARERISSMDLLVIKGTETRNIAKLFGVPQIEKKNGFRDENLQDSAPAKRFVIFFRKVRYENPNLSDSVPAIRHAKR